MKAQTKRILAVLLGLCLLISLMPAMAIGAAAAATRTVYFDNTNTDWSKVSVYAWNDSGECTGQWPGAEMTPVSGSIYSYEVPTDAVYIIFSGDGSQTSDFVIPTDGRNLFDGNDWVTYTVPSAPSTQDLYLVGYINGSSYGCDDDYQNLGSYKFENGKLTATFSQDSYVFVKTGDNQNWYMTEAYCTDNSCTLFLGGREKMFVPGNQKVEFTLVRNGDDSITLSYQVKNCTHNYQNGLCTACGNEDPNYVPPGNSYILVSDLDEITSGGQFVIVAKYHGSYRAMGTSFNSRSFPVEVSVSGKQVTGDNLPVWSISPVMGGISLKCDNGYLRYTSGDQLTLNSATQTWVVNKGTKGFVFYPFGASLRTLGYLNNRFGAFVQADGAITELLVYKNSGKCANHRYAVSVSPEATCETDGTRTTTCTICGDSYSETIPATGHSYVGKICSVCGASKPDYYLFGYINGADYGVGEDLSNLGEYKFVNGKLTVTFQETSYIAVKTGDNNSFYMTNSYLGPVTSATLYKFADPYAPEADKLQIPGGQTITFTLTNQGSNLVISYAANSGTCAHTAHTTDGLCITCGAAVAHSYYLGYCTVCNGQDPNYVAQDYYFFGYINGVDYSMDADISNLGQYKFAYNKLTVTFTQDSYVAIKKVDPATAQVIRWYMTDGWQGNDRTSVNLYDSDTMEAPDKFFVPGNVKVTFTLTENADGSLTLSYVFAEPSCVHASHSMDGICTSCGATVQHSFSMGVCTLCSALDPDYNAYNFYLFGYINGVDYGMGDTVDPQDPFKFVGNRLTITFTQDSYIGIRRTTAGSDAVDWYMTNGWAGAGTNTVTLYNRNDLTNADKLYIPGGVEVTFILTQNWEDTLTLRYTLPTSTPATVPTLKAEYPTVSFEDIIVMNIYFDAQNTQDVLEMGLMTFNTKVSKPSVDTAVDIIPSYTWNESVSLNVASTKGIAAKELGKTIYFAVYALLTDGSYAYSDVNGYSVLKYATKQLETGSAAQKALMVATLNYGAAAQKNFGYNTGKLVNASLTSAQKALVKSYSDSMISVAEKPSTSKLGAMQNNGGYAKRYATVSFEGAFSINYYFAPSAAPKGNITMYVWTQAAYNAASSLSKNNASYAITMVQQNNSEYLATIEGIAAKQLNDAVYVSFCYSDGNTNYCSGVSGYSIGQYCKSQASGTGTMAELAKATAVYGYYAKQRFG